jgi:hypothetical protein
MGEVVETATWKDRYERISTTSWKLRVVPPSSNLTVLLSITLGEER